MKFSRVFDFSRGLVTITYDPEAAQDECVFIDHSGPLFLTLDETHRFHAFFMGFLAIAREMPKRPTHAQVQQAAELPKDFSVKKLPTGDFTILPDSSTQEGLS
jgi:hypothetical protein